jgi:hypothetical protein
MVWQTCDTCQLKFIANRCFGKITRFQRQVCTPMNSFQTNKQKYGKDCKNRLLLKKITTIADKKGGLQRAQKQHHCRLLIRKKSPQTPAALTWYLRLLWVGGSVVVRALGRRLLQVGTLGAYFPPIP